MKPIAAAAVEDSGQHKEQDDHGKDCDQLLKRDWYYNIPVVVVAIVLLMVALGVGLGLFFYFKTEEKKQIQYTLKSESLVYTQNVERIMDAALRDVVMLKAMINVLPQLTYAQFVSYTNSSDSLQNGCYALEWIPEVPDDQRGSFEQSIRNTGVPEFADYMIKEPGDGDWVPAQTRPYYYPILWAVPMSRNQAVLGLDLASESMRYNTVMYSKLTNKPAASSKIYLAENTEKISAIFLLAPVTDSTTGEYLGSTFGLFELNQLIRVAMGDLKIITVSVVDMNETNTDTAFLYSTLDGTDSKRLQAERLWEKAEYRVYTDVAVANRVYRMYFTANKQFIKAHERPSKWVALFIPFAVVIIIYAGFVYLLKTVQYSKRLSHLQQDRLHLMEESNTKLNNLLDKISLEEQKTHAVINGFHDAVLTVGPDGKIVLTNDAFNKMFHRISSKDIAGTTLQQIFSKFTTIEALDNQEVEVSTMFGITKTVKANVSVSTLSTSHNQQQTLTTIVLRDESERKDLIDILGKEKEKLIDMHMIIELDSMLQNRELRDKFYEFCLSEHSIENLCFIEEVVEYRSITRVNERIEKKERIFGT